MRRLPWVVRGYYAADVKPPKTPDGLAIEVRGLSKEVLAMDLDILQKRDDIGRIDGPWKESDR
jgi:hypothetical protein